MLTVFEKCRSFGHARPKEVRWPPGEVEGRLQKPNAFYVLQRSSIDYDWETLNQGFLPKIIQATGQRPF